MIDIITAIYAAYPNVVTIYGNVFPDIKAIDANDNDVPLDQSIVLAKQTVLENQYLIDQCKIKAENLLKDTDWSTLSDITIGNPKLLNQADFLSYRSQVRALAINPISSPVFPDLPISQWGS